MALHFTKKKSSLDKLIFPIFKDDLGLSCSLTGVAPLKIPFGLGLALIWLQKTGTTYVCDFKKLKRFVSGPSIIKLIVVYVKTAGVFVEFCLQL